MKDTSKRFKLDELKSKLARMKDGGLPYYIFIAAGALGFYNLYSNSSNKT